MNRPIDWAGYSSSARINKPNGHISTTPETLESLLFAAGGAIVIPDGGGWATLENRKGKFTAWYDRDVAS